MDWQEATSEILRRHGVRPSGAMERAARTEHVVVLTGDFVLKLFAATRQQFDREAIALEIVRGWRMPAPRIIATGDYQETKYILMTRLPGSPLVDRWQLLSGEDQLQFMTAIGAGLRDLHQISVAPPAALELHWNEFLEAQTASLISRQLSCGIPREWVPEVEGYARDRESLRAETLVFLHGDVHGGNVLHQGSTITGVIDYADSLFGPPAYDLVPPCVLMAAGNRTLQRAFLRSYGYADRDFTPDLRRYLMLLTVYYECSDLMKYARRIGTNSVPSSLRDLEEELWPFV